VLVRCRKSCRAWLCPPGASGRGGRPGCGSIRPGRSRTCGSAPPPAAGPGRPGPGMPFSLRQDRTCDRKNLGATPYGRPCFPAPRRGAPDSLPA
jgi:hypothetical protein